MLQNMTVNDLNCIYKMKQKVSEAFFIFANERDVFKAFFNFYKIKENTFWKPFLY